MQKKESRFPFHFWAWKKNIFQVLHPIKCQNMIDLKLGFFFFFFLDQKKLSKGVSANFQEMKMVGLNREGLQRTSGSSDEPEGS